MIRGADVRPIRHFYGRRLGEFSIPSMDLEEIMAEKIRSLAYAQKPRHLYDLWYLFQHGIRLDSDQVDSKLAFHGNEPVMERIREGIDKAKTRWDVALNPLLPTVLSFDEISKNVA